MKYKTPAEVKRVPNSVKKFTKVVSFNDRIPYSGYVSTDIGVLNNKRYRDISTLIVLGMVKTVDMI